MVDFLLAISHQLYMAQTKVRPIVTPKKLSEDCQEFFENIIRGCDLYLCHWNFVLTCNPRLRGVEMLTHKFVHMVQVSSERPLHGKNEFTVPLYYNFLSAVEMHKKISQTSIGACALLAKRSDCRSPPSFKHAGTRYFRSFWCAVARYSSARYSMLKYAGIR